MLYIPLVQKFKEKFPLWAIVTKYAPYKIHLITSATNIITIMCVSSWEWMATVTCNPVLRAPSRAHTPRLSIKGSQNPTLCPLSLHNHQAVTQFFGVTQFFWEGHNFVFLYPTGQPTDNSAQTCMGWSCRTWRSTSRTSMGTTCGRRCHHHHQPLKIFQFRFPGQGIAQHRARCVWGEWGFSWSSSRWRKPLRKIFCGWKLKILIGRSSNNGAEALTKKCTWQFWRI